MQKCGRDFNNELIERIKITVDAEPTVSRRALSLRVCEWLGWKSLNGKPKEMSCRVALLRLNREDLINLPVGRPKDSFFRPKAKNCTSVEVASVQSELRDLGEIEIIPIDGSERSLSRIWNEIMQQHHYLGAGPLCGAQLRYLIKSATYGWLGGLSFSAAAWRVSARDQWIGWNNDARRENLQLVVCNSRFLIGPEVRVPNLASHVLAQCVKRLGQDWRQRYGYDPVLLETYVERGRFVGTCYQAANFIQVGETEGRGRQDRDNACGAPVKDVYIYPLRDDAKAVLCRQSIPRQPETPPAKEFKDWAEEEFGGVNLGDERLIRRLETIARDFYTCPQGNIPQACKTRAKAKAAYRFFSHPDTNMNTLLSQHYEVTTNRCRAEAVVLAVQDTTSLNYSTHPATADLGLIGNRKDGPIGLLVHDTMAFTPEGVPLGLLDVQCWARDPEDFGKKNLRGRLPIEEKESFKWLESYQKVAKAQDQCPNTTFVSVGDREADIYELFSMATAQKKGPQLLVRAEWNRVLADNQGHLWETLARLENAGAIALEVPRQHDRQKRIAQLEIRFAEVNLKPSKRHKKLLQVRIWAIMASETNPPEDVKPLEWMLLTTCPVSNFDQALEKVGWYAKRWGIEVYHRTLKSGCKIEERQLGSADRIEACLAIDMVVAWRIYHLTMLGREIPNVPCTAFFQEAEWTALNAYVQKDPIPPAEPPTLRMAIMMVASLGGFLGRKCDGEPGTKSLWLGLQRLDDLTAMWKVMTSYTSAPHPPPVSRNPTYG
ncbi:MAG: IS4 family transposase [Pseudomonadota bacterium]